MANNGGPAFPDPGSTFGRKGMALRDWFAGQIAAAAMTNAKGLGSVDAADRRAMFAQAASLAYEFADAMIAERAKGDANG